jgi:hypothetical protein
MGDDEIEKLGDVQPIEISAGSPVLFLGVLDTRLRFKGGSVLIDHQTSGIACGRLDARGVVLREFLVDVWLQAADIAQHCARLTRGREHISKVLAAGTSHPSPSGEAILRRTLNPKP